MNHQTVTVRSSSSPTRLTRRPMAMLALAGAACSIVLFSVGLGAGPSQPDTPTLIGMLGKKIDDLDARNVRDAAELAEARREIRESRDQIVALREQVTGLKGDLAQIKTMLTTLVRPASVAAVPTLTIPEDPMASPDAMLEGLRARYTKAFEGVVADNDLARRDRLKEIDRWCRDINRELRGKSRWLARIDSVAPASADAGAPKDAAFVVTYTVLDATSRAAISSSQTVPVPSHIGNKLKEHPEGTIAEVGVFFSAAVTFDETRVETGIFGTPIMVGPHVVHGVSLEWTSVEPVRGSSRPERPPTDPAR